MLVPVLIWFVYTKSQDYCNDRPYHRPQMTGLFCRGYVISARLWMDGILGHKDEERVHSLHVEEVGCFSEAPWPCCSVDLNVLQRPICSGFSLSSVLLGDGRNFKRWELVGRLLTFYRIVG